MSEEKAQEYYRFLSSVASGGTRRKQLEIFSRYMNEADLRSVTGVMNEILSKSLENMVHAKVFLLLLDHNDIFKAIGKAKYDQLLHSIKGGGVNQEMVKLLDQSKRLRPKVAALFKAKVGMLLQLLFLLRERVKEEGLPPIKLSAPDLGFMALKELDSKKQMVIQLDDFGKGYWNLLVELLKEADFRSDDKRKYELVLSDQMIKTYSSGNHLAGSAKGEAGQAGLSDVMLARLGRNLVKRIGLLLRTVQMYQSAEHPSVEMSLEALQGTVSEILQHRKSITLTRMGSDLLIDDVKNRKKEKFVDDFVQQLDERNVNSITITQGVSVEEMRVLSTLFTQTHTQVKQAGGASRILEKGGVTHILMDQFKYGIISGDAEDEEAEAVSRDDKMVENIVFTELVSRLKEGKGLGDLKSEDVGAAFKQLISGTYRKDKNARKSLAQMLLAIDPGLAERALFSKEGLQDDLQWSSARRMIDELIVELPRGDADARIHTLANLVRMAGISISKNKDTTLTVIIEKIIERLRLRERDLDVVTQVIDSLSKITKELIINGKYGQALEILRNLYQVKNRCEHLPTEKRDDFSYATPDIIARGMTAVSDPDVVDAMVRDLDNDSLETIDRIVRILELLNTEEVVVKLLGGFVHESRSVRNRCFQALYSIGDKTLAVTTWKIKSLDDEKVFPRQADGSLVEESFYLARNSVDLISKLGKANEVETLKGITDDPDPRIRREVMLSLAQMDSNEGIFLARLRLTDPSELVIKAAISTLGKLKADGADKDLIDLFFAQPELRATILSALALIGGSETEDLLIVATKFRFGGNTGRIYSANPELRSIAIKALGQCAREKGEAALRKFTHRLKNPFLRIFFFPIRSLKSSKELLKIAIEALARVQFRLKKVS
jgi:HEAT repeat protein